MALTVHRTVIHYHSVASLPQGEAFGITASLWTEAESNEYISLLQWEKVSRLCVTDEVLFLMNNEVASLMNNE